MSSQPKWSLGSWAYEWNANGSLKKVQRPDGSVISFKYDAFGRRISKTYHRREFLYIWDKNVPLHEIQKEELCEDNIITWIFEGFTPTAKLINGKAYSIISDHLGTPLLAIDTQGNKVWERELDIYGRVRKEFTHDSVKDRRSGFMPFLYAGQYYDKETELAYNRFRYYSTDTAAYISQDPIGLAGGNPTLYGYVTDTNTWIDVFGLDCSQEILRNVNSLMGRKKEEIQKQLQEQGFSKTEARNGGEIWIKAGDDGKTVAIRLDPAKVRQRPKGHADEVPHAHKEIVSTTNVIDGNYPQNTATTLDDLGNITNDPFSIHIPIIE